MNRHARLLFLFTLFLSRVAVAQNYASGWYSDIFGENSGHTTCGFLSLPLSAGVLGTGAIPSQGMMDATDLPHYTANIGLTEKNLFAVTHLEWMMGLRKEFAGAVAPIYGVGAVGIFSQLFTTGSDRHSYTIDQVPSEWALLEYAVGAAFGRSFLAKRLSIGGTASYVESRLDDCVGRAFAATADLLLLPVAGMSSRLYVRNFGTDVTYTANAEPLPLQVGASISFAPLGTESPEQGRTNTVSVSAGLQKTADEPLTTGIGFDITPIHYLCVRAGYEYPLGSEASMAGLSAGIGVRIQRYGMDGAWKYQSPVFGSIWAASVKMEINEFYRRTPKEYLSLAEESFGRGRYKDCIHYAKKSLRRDPNQWKAQTLISKAKSEILRQQKLEIAIIYTGNIRGQFLPPFAPGALGGLARQATAIKNIRRQFPVSFSIAAGNIVAPRSHPLKAALAHAYYRHIDHDARGLGENEFDYGLQRFFETDSLHAPFVCLGGADLVKKGIVPVTIIDRGGYSAAVISIVNHPKLTASLEKRRTSLANEIGLELKRGDIRKCNLRIVIVHAPWNAVKELATGLQGADIIICGSIDQYFQTPMRIGSSFVVSAGGGGQFIGNLQVRFDARKRLLSVDNRLIPLTDDVPDDSTVARLVSAITAKEEIKETGITLKQSNTQGVFPFLSNRSGVADIYLKVLGSHAEFSLTRGAAAIGSPSISFTAGLIAFSREDTANGCRPLDVMTLSGTQRRTVVGGATVREATFSPDGKWLYYAAAPCGDTITDLYRMVSPGGPAIPVVTWSKSTERSVTFSPDFSELVFCSDRDDSWQLYLTSPEGAQPVRLTEDIGNHLQPGFSPDGACLAYLSNYANPKGGFDLWLFDRPSGRHRQLTRKTNINGYCWLDDSRSIVYSSGLDFPRLMTVDIATGESSRLIPPDSSQRQYAETDPRLLTYNDEKKLIYVREFENGERAIYWVSLDGGNDQCIVTGTGNNWLR